MIRTNFAKCMAAFTEVFVALRPCSVNLLMSEPNLHRVISIMPHRRPNRIVTMITTTRGSPDSFYDFILSGPILYHRAILCNPDFINAMVEDFPENGEMYYVTHEELFGFNGRDSARLFDLCPQ